MPKFDSSTVGDVEYDFTGWKGVKGSLYEGVPIDDKGVIPEPSRNMVSTTMKRITEAFKVLDDSIGENEDADPESLVNAMDKINDEETFDKLGAELFEAVADLCDGSPRRESLEALGWRRFMAFFGYVMGELMSPEVGNAGSGRTPRKLRSV